jgi:ribosomal protein L37E
MSGKYRKEHNCLNCGFHVEEHYCSRCGQPNLELKENFWQFISHSIAHYFHFDNKFFQTLVPLITKPGKVTLDYLAGKRARYINPISMYIFVSIVYFLVVYAPKGKDKHAEGTKTEKVITDANDIEGLDSIATPLSKAGLNGQQIAAITKKAVQQGLTERNYRRLSFKQQDSILIDLQKQYQSQKTDSLSEIIGDFEKIHIAKNDSTYAAYLARQEKLSPSERDNFLERFMAKRRIGIGEKSDVIQEQLDHNKPKQYFLFMPLMALFIMVNFRKNHIKYLDHLIFTIHGMTAFFIVSSFVQPVKKLLFANSGTISGIIEVALILWICWYLFKSLKIFYQRKTSTTIWRMLWIIILYSITLEITENIMRNIIFYIAT